MMLNGMKEISNYMSLSESSIVDLIQRGGFPAKLTEESTWQADSDDIDQWKRGPKTKNVPSKEAKAKPAVKAEAESEKVSKSTKSSGGKK